MQPREGDTAPINVKTLDLGGLEMLAQSMGQPSYRGRQLFEWIYGKHAQSFKEMTNLPLAFREALAARCFLESAALAALKTSQDGTAKALFTLRSGRQIETVLIPEESAERFTACVSSQVGCAMGCTFCATGLMGFSQNLTPGEIYDQARFMDALARKRFGRGLTNIVYMGMGEPLLNYASVLQSLALFSDPHAMDFAARRITVSTVGLARRIRAFADDDPGANLAVSLHAPTAEKRSQILPVSRGHATGLGPLLESLQYYTRRTRRRVTFEYCLFLGFNDTTGDARTLVDICRRVHSKVNLIMYNPVPGLDFARTTEARLNAFARTLADAGVTVTVRRSRGQDIDAACGQLFAAQQQA